MALKITLILAISASWCASTDGEMALANVTRLASGDVFSIVGTDCGLTRCMESSHSTALGTALGDDGCVCRCRKETPAFREDRRVCVNHIDDCLMASFGRGATKPLIPFVFLPLKGQIIYPSKEIIFTDVENAACAVTSAQYLSTSGWVTLRDLVDNDVPFGLYRDEGSTFLQWRGSASLHTRLDGRLVLVHVLCSSGKTHIASSCAAFRIAGASSNGLFDVRSIPFHAGEIVSKESPTQSQGLSVLESLAIGVCVLMLIFIYAAGIIFYVHYKKKQKKKKKDAENNMSSNSSENGSSLESRIDMSNVMLKTNPLLKFNGIGNDFMLDSGMSDSDRNDTLESTKSTVNSLSSNNGIKMNSNVVSAMVHSKRKKPSRPSMRQGSYADRLNERLQRRSSSPDTFERAPHSDLSIVDCPMENHYEFEREISPEGDPVIRKKLYFNPVFFETEHLKDPPPAAIEFLIKIREVMSIAKDKMTSKRFIPILSDIPEEDRYHSVDLGWDIPCARRGRRFSAISLKQENSRKSVHCGGCPGCDSNGKSQKATVLTRSNSCTSCVSEDYKQRIVRKWLDEVPIPEPTTPAPKSIKSIAKVNGTPRVIEAQPKELHLTAEPIKVEESKILNNQADGKENSKLVIESLITKTEDMSDSPVKLALSKSIITVVPQVEKKSPSSHASRRVRKKLPPPPPPPGKTMTPLPPIPTQPLKLKEKEPIPLELKVKMEAVIHELNHCKRVEPLELEEIKLETILPIGITPKLVIPVVAADTMYNSDDNVLTNSRKKKFANEDDSMDFDSLERNMVRRRRFSLACGPELGIYMNDLGNERRSMVDRERLTNSWLDMTKVIYDTPKPLRFSHIQGKSNSVNEIVIGTSEPLYDNISKPGPLTIQVRGSPVENRRNSCDDFDPDTLDRKPKHDSNKRVEKIFLKSAGSFKHTSPSPENALRMSPELDYNNKIGNLRHIYEMKANAQLDEIPAYKRRGSLQYGGQDLADFMRALKTPDLIRHVDGQKGPKPPIPPKVRRDSDASVRRGSDASIRRGSDASVRRGSDASVRRGSDASAKFAPLRESPPDRRRALEERDRFGAYSRAENLNARRSGRRSARTRSRRTDLKKLYRTEDSGYMSTDSNESKRRAKYLLQLRPKTAINESNLIQVTRTVNKAPVVIESDTDDLESLCDGRSESGGESVETDSVFFGNFDDSKEMFEELGLNSFNRKQIGQLHEQIDSGFMGETNIILSGDSDSEHRSVISITTGRDGRASATSIKNVDDSHYLHAKSVNC